MVERCEFLPRVPGPRVFRLCALAEPRAFAQPELKAMFWWTVDHAECCMRAGGWNSGFGIVSVPRVLCADAGRRDRRFLGLGPLAGCAIPAIVFAPYDSAAGDCF